MYPDATIEVEPRWFVRVVTKIPTSNIGHTLTVDVRNLPGEPPATTEEPS